MSRTIDSIDIPAWPPCPWPCASSAARRRRGRAGRGRASQRVADVPGHGLAGAVVAAFLGPTRAGPPTERAGSNVTVAVCATGFASTARTPGRWPSTCSTTAFSARVVEAADVQDDGRAWAETVDAMAASP